ncbi:hypothetical protein [Gimesia panareensis]|uniref:hypothetical protein n=1 Tax=Gimesia panareensis TaxID=2527978 RepID=UPI001187EE9E|nr:hypothetical protein [Gimesia panareensis]QDU50513.1 hypothetical protein Pan110_28650 [Gimesia panareensis]
MGLPTCPACHEPLIDIGEPENLVCENSECLKSQYHIGVKCWCGSPPAEILSLGGFPEYICEDSHKFRHKARRVPELYKRD